MVAKKFKVAHSGCQLFVSEQFFSETMNVVNSIRTNVLHMQRLKHLPIIPL